MNSAHALATRIYLGLTVNQLADILDVHERSVRRWEDPERDGPPPGVVDELTELVSRYDALVDALVDDDGDTIAIPRHPGAPRPAWAPRDTPHELLVAAAALAALSADKTVTWEPAAD